MAVYKPLAYNILRAKFYDLLTSSRFLAYNIIRKKVR